MAIPEHKFVSAHFTDEQKTTVEVQWEALDGKTRVEYIIAEEDNVHWKNLLEHISIDELHESTYKYIKHEQEVMEDAVLNVAKARGMLYDPKTDNTYKRLTSFIFGEFDEEKDRENLFAFKLALFEVDQIQKSKSRALKTKLRKAKNIKEALQVSLQIAKT